MEHQLEVILQAIRVIWNEGESLIKEIDRLMSQQDGGEADVVREKYAELQDLRSRYSKLIGEANVIDSKATTRFVDFVKKEKRIKRESHEREKEIYRKLSNIPQVFRGKKFENIDF